MVHQKLKARRRCDVSIDIVGWREDPLRRWVTAPCRGGSRACADLESTMNKGREVTPRELRLRRARVVQDVPRLESRTRLASDQLKSINRAC